MIIETERLSFRTFTPDDAADYHRIVTDEDVRRFAPPGAKPTRTVEEYKRLLTSPPTGTASFYAAVCKQSESILGLCGFKELDESLNEFCETQTSEIFVQLLPEYREQRYGTEIARALIENAFTERKDKRVIGIPHPCNTRSIALLDAIKMLPWLSITAPEHTLYKWTVYSRTS